MTRISKFRLYDNQLKELTDHFSFLISSLKTSEEIENFFDSFFTKEEKIMLTKRLVLFMMIQRGYNPKAIQSALHISYETVRTYTNQFANKNTQFQKMIEKLISREKAKEFWEKVEKMLKPIELALNAKRDMKARAKLISGDWS